jgi:hypothetical protein
MTTRTTNSAKNVVSAKKHDVGLTKSEKIFVHALRDLFDPKGKRAVVSMSPKGFVSPKSLKSEASATKREKDRLALKKAQKDEKRHGKHFLYREGHLPPASNLSKWKHPYQQRRKANAKRFEKDLAEKRKDSEKKSRSQLRRAAKRVKLQLDYAEKNRKAGTVTAARKAFDNLTNFQKMASAVPQRGIEVVQAFGGEQCLRMLGSISYRKEYSLNMCQGDSPKGRVRKVHRDYTRMPIREMKSINGSEKNRDAYMVPKQKRKAEKLNKSVKPKAERLNKGKTKEKADDKAKSADRKVGASALRRKLQRRERALEKAREAAEKPVEIVSPQVIQTSVSGGSSAKDEFKDALKLLAEKQDNYFKRMRTVITNRPLFEAWLKGTSPSSLRNNVAEYNTQLKALQVRIRWVAKEAGVELSSSDIEILRDIFK